MRLSYQNRFLLIALVLGVLTYMVIASLNLPFYLSWLISCSVATFFLYGFDKFQAKRDGLRVPEIVFHLLAIVGGFVGGWLGMFTFRHKTTKLIFKVVLALGTLLYLGLIIYLQL